jgi:PAS domain S-box-containing protein
MESQPLIESVLGGGGEMGERMRAFDWSTTALGPLERWPQSLRICVRIILGSGYPMTIYWGPEYTMLYNDACQQVMGTKHPAALGHSFREVFPEMSDSVGLLFNRIMKDGQDYSSLTDQLFLLNRNNYLEECYFAVSFSPIPDDTGEVGGVLGTSLETTERVIEDRRRQVLRDLASRTAEARYEDEVWRVSADTLGEHRLTIPFAFFYAYHPTERKAFRVGPGIDPEALDPSVTDCTSQNLWGFETALPVEGIVVELGQRASLLLPSTSWPVPPEKAAVVPIRLSEQSDAAGFLVLGIHPGRAFDDPYRQFVRRIAEQIAIGLASARAYELQLRRADALAEIDRVKTAFFSNVSHEFRTPLQLMLGPLEEVLPEAGERLGPDRHQQLLTARRNALRLLKLVNTLLDVSRLEAGRVQAVYQPTDLAGLTSDIASMFRSAMDGAGLQFSVECQPIAEPVFVDRGMWEKIVLNLLSNAFKFTFEGEVAISLKRVNGAVELQVRDTGGGIPDDQREKVFERFHRIGRTSARTHEGTGIGLALVQELVKLHGGSVEVKSAVGVGSTFTVTIPCGREHLPAESVHAEESLALSDMRAEAYVEEALRWVPEGSSAPAGVPMLARLSPLPSSREAVLGSERELIVVADDNADMREYLTRLLGDRYDVCAVADGHQALDVARQLRPALVLADVMMPQLDGFGLLRAIRADSVLCSTPVILVSARAGEESRVEGLQADADDYLVKPFTSRELLARVAMHVKMAHLRRVTAEREERLRDLGERDHESRLIVETIPGFVASLSPAGELEFVNQGLIEYCGQGLEAMKQWGTNGTVHADDLPHVVELFTRGITSGEPYDFDARIRRHDGVYRWFQIRGLPLRDMGGQIVRWYSLLVDIEDRKRAEDAQVRQAGVRADVNAAFSKATRLGEILRGCAEAIVRHLDAAFARIWMLNKDEGMLELQASAGMYTRLDGSYSRIPVGDLKVGWIAREKTAHLTNDVMNDPRVKDKGWAQSTGMVAFAGYPLVVEDRLIGVVALFARRPLSESILDTLASVAGTIAQGIERKRAEEAVRAREREARLIVDSIPGPVALLNKNGDLQFVNRQIVEYTGRTLEELQQWGTNDTVHPDDLPHAIEVFTRSIASGSPYEIVQRLRRSDGAYRWFQHNGFPVHDSSRDILLWCVLLTDIDERKRAETELAALKDQLYKENLVLRDEVDRTSMFEEIVGTSPALQPVLARVAKVAPTDSTVLITGETGTGKELVARAIHRRSARASRAFVSVNCAAVPRDLIASELFGHEKGAFTGATQRRLGRFELAHGGTLFLDEVGDVPMETQVALLRVLQEREFVRVGGTSPVQVDVRVVAATNRDLQAAIEAGAFRSDLFYRLNVFPIAVPALRERTDDIQLLVEYFIDRFARQAGKTIRRVNKRTLDRLRSYPWPGNVRELQNVIERSVIVCDTDEFTVDESWLFTRRASDSRALSNTLANHERTIIEDALRASGGRVFGPSGAAARLGVARSTLESKIRGLRIDKNRFRSRPTKP